MPRLSSNDCGRVEFLPPGGLTLDLPPGEWIALVTRGLEYEAVEKSVTVVAGSAVTVDAALVRSVETTGWLPRPNAPASRDADEDEFKVALRSVRPRA
jgi:hypothetical protein